MAALIAPGEPGRTLVPLRRMERQYAGIQYMRGGAAMTVLLVHSFMPVFGPIRYAGLVISLFFLISGFLVVAITSDATRPRRFMLARIRRIGPVYWLLTGLAAILLWGGVNWQSPIPFWHLFSYDPPLPWRFIAASLAFIPAWNQGAGTVQPVNPVGWTVNLEMLYYAIFALLLYLPRRWLMPALTIAIGTLALIGIFNRPDHPALWAWTHPIGLDFLIGAWIGHAWQTRGNMWRVLGWCSLAVITVLLLRAVMGHFDPLIFAALFGPIFGALFVAVIRAEERGEGIRAARLPMLIGNASYSIYLTQFSVMLMLNLAGVPHGLLFGVVQLILSTSLGIVIHLLLEDPLLRLMGRKPIKPPDRDSGHDRGQSVAG